MASIDAIGEGSSNYVLQGSNDNNGTEELNNESFQSTQTIADSATTNISATSSSNLLVPGKLYSDLLKLKQCYIEIIKLIDIHSLPSSNSPEDNHNIVLMLNKEQIAAGVNKKLKLAGAKNNLANLLDCVRPLVLPSYHCDTSCHKSPAVPDSQLSSLSSRVEELSSQNKADFASITTQLDSLKSALANFENLASNI